MTHLPVIPVSYGGQPDWIVYGQRPDKPAKRRRMITLLAQRNAIVLTAHVHRTNLTRYRSEEGTITQFVSYSIMGPGEQPPFREEKLTTESYFARPAIRKAMEKARVKAVMDDFSDKIVDSTDYYPDAGFNILRVDEGGVSIDLYCAPGKESAATIRLKP